MCARKFLAVIFVVFVSACSSFKVGIEPTPHATGSAPPSVVPTATQLMATSVVPSASPTTLPAPIELPPTARPSLQPIASPRPKITPGVPLTITLFTASPDIINPGDSFTLTWSATGSDAVLRSLGPDGRSWFLPYSVPLTGTMVMTSEKDQRNYIYLDLIVSNPAPFKYVQVGLEIELRCPDTWFFANGPASCPWPAITGQAAIQHFEHGLMIWLEPRQRIYILYEKSEYRSDVNARIEVDDHFVEGQPESDPNLTPLAGLYQPIRGFGLAWRDDQNAPGYRVRDRLGWATDHETAFQSVLQCDSWQKYQSCYLLQDDGRVIRLRSMGMNWEYWEQP